MFQLCSTLSTQDNAQLLQELKSDFKRTINWNKCKSKVTIERQNQHVDYLIGSIFQGVNRLFVLSFSYQTGRTGNFLSRRTNKRLLCYDG